MSCLVCIGSCIVVVSSIDKLGKTEDGNKNQGGEPRGQHSPGFPEKKINRGRNRAEDCEICKDNDNQAGAKDPKNGRVEILG